MEVPACFPCMGVNRIERNLIDAADIHLKLKM